MQPLDIKHHYPLKGLNSFGLNVFAGTYFKLSSQHQIEQALDEMEKAEKSLLLGGGSNILFAGDFEGTVIHVDLKGKELVDRDNDHIYLKFGAGEIWHEAVLFCLANGWGGIENLSLIPGTVGAAPIQNIGAYGIELEDSFHELEAIELSGRDMRVFSRDDCHFGYRDSIFKGVERGNYFITSVTLRLSLHNKITLTHDTLRRQLAAMGVSVPTIQDVSKAVIAVRQRNLPDPQKLGNGGSFFKNPIVTSEFYHSLQRQWPALPGYRISESEVKIPAGWLIEQSGWKGRIIDGKCGVHDRQALVLVNYGTASGRDILDLSTDIAASVEDIFGVSLDREVNVIL